MKREEFTSLRKVVPSSWVERIGRITIMIVLILIGMLFLPWQHN